MKFLIMRMVGILLRPITDWVSTKRGMWITLAIWLVITVALSVGPKLSDYKVSNFQSLPSDAQSLIAEAKTKQFFPDDQGTPGILVFHRSSGEVQVSEVGEIIKAIKDANIAGIEQIVDIHLLPKQAISSFLSEDKSTLIVPMTLSDDLGSKEYGEINDRALEIGNNVAKSFKNLAFYITGPAGIAGDTVKLFENADVALLIATIVIILVLLIVIYRSPLLAFIPLLATAIVYQVANQTIALLGTQGLEISSQTSSIMSILLFAAVIDYSLFVFSRYREELNTYESKYEAMKHAMQATGQPVFFAGGTVLAAMLILFTANFRDYENFAPVFSTTMLIIMIASITLVPALFTLFGRKSFWPKVPTFGQAKEVKHGIWGPIAKFVVNRPLLSGGLVTLFLIVTALNVFSLRFEFNMVESFPKDLPSRVGYEIVESKFDKGELAPTTVLVVSDNAIQADATQKLQQKLESYAEIASVRLSNQKEDKTAIKYSIALKLNPYSVAAIDFVEKVRANSGSLLKDSGIDGEIYFGGTTPKLVDERMINNEDIIKIVALETLLILVLLFGLTRSVKMSIYMMLTILISYLSALGLGLFLIDVLFGYEAISTRVPVYAFIFLVALGIDYNIILVSRFLEERKTRKVKDALEIAIKNTGGVISSAGVILAATFAALTTMPIADLFVFGFMVAVGILIDTFFVRGLLLPSLILFFEKDKTEQTDSKLATEK
jgi:RND superfamily putative drug exporter